MKLLAIALIRVYQRILSPLLPSSCIYQPSCSNYAIEAFSKHGFLRGAWMTAARLWRCWPWSTGGFDPVP